MDYWKSIKQENNIKYISIIIYTILDDNVLFLVGKEYNNKQNKTDIGLWSDFYGTIENDESIYEATTRILFEKTMNMIIKQNEFKNLVINNKLNYKIKKDRIIFLYKIEYDRHKFLPENFNNVFEYMNLCRNLNSTNNWVIESCPFDYFDKSELKWVNYDFIKTNIKIFKQLFINSCLN
jgi:hypothetical protein